MYMELLLILVLAVDILVLFYQQWFWMCFPQWWGSSGSARSLQSPLWASPFHWGSLWNSALGIVRTQSSAGPCQIQLPLPPKRTQTQGQNERTHTKLCQELPPPFPALSRLSCCPEPPPTPSSNSGSAPGSSLANSNGAFWTCWIKNCSFSILGIAREGHHLSSSLTSSLVWSPASIYCHFLPFCWFPLNFSSSSSLSTPTHVSLFLWLVLSLFSAFPNSHF